MKTKNIVLNSHNEEIIQYTIPHWLHSFEHTILDDTILKYIPLHWHEELQFILVTHGTIEIRLLGKSFLVSKGSGFFINSGLIHEIHPIDKGSIFICWNTGTSGFDEHLQEKIIRALIEEQTIPYLRLDPHNTAYNQILKLISDSFTKFEEAKSGFELLISSNYLRCLYELVNSMDSFNSVKVQVYDQRIKQLLHYIHSHYKSKITLDDLSRLIYLSTAETNRLFKKYMRSSPFAYILDYRLERSVELLVRTQSSITEIALETGFSNVSYYIKKFKLKYNTTPLKYRESNRNISMPFRGDYAE